MDASRNEMKYAQLEVPKGQAAVVSGTIADEATGDPIPVAVVFGPHGIEIKIEGYGEKCAQDGFGSPVFVDFYKGEINVLVWDDINEEEPKKISLEGAREKLRKDKTE